MLKLTNIRKTYTVGDLTVDALRGISMEFRDNEFVSILGPSGCGKTTTLNIIGGLDRYTSGDLIINWPSPCPGCPRESVAAGPRRPWNRWASATTCTSGPISSPAARCSG